MNRIRTLLLAASVGLLGLSAPARANDLLEFGPLSTLFHTYGGDVNRPPMTPDRPYWHGDDAVPPSLRWHERDIEVVDEYGYTIGTRLPPPVETVVAVEAAVVVARPAPRHNHVKRRRPVRSRLARGYCPPVVVPAPVASFEPPPVPAPTEH